VQKIIDIDHDRSVMILWRSKVKNELLPARVFHTTQQGGKLGCIERT
jgi:hypothetical protein